MEIGKFLAAAILTVIVFSFVRAWNPSFDIPLKLTAAVLFLSALLAFAKPILESIADMTENSALAGHAKTLLLAVGIAILTQTVSEICRECKETAVAGYVEMAGRLNILLLCLPLLKEIFSAVEELL